MNTTTIGKTEYILFSVERSDMGGRMNKKDTLKMLRDHGIKYSLTDAYTVYMGQWAVYIETCKEKEAEELLFGKGCNCH